MSWLLDENGGPPHRLLTVCDICIERFNLFDNLLTAVSCCKLPGTRKMYYASKVIKVQSNLDLYIGHLVRGKHQRSKFLEEIEHLQPGKAVAVCDYMMKLLLQKFREPQRDWYAKKGVSLHGTMFFYKTPGADEIEVEIHDLFSNGDCVQNWYFTASAFEATFQNFASKHDEISSLVIWSDNGPHCHNTSLILWLMRFRELCRLTIDRYSFFEAQKGKTSLDSHFATFKFVLRSWMKRGNDILGSEDIVSGTADHLKGTHVYEIYLDRSKEPKSATTWKGITQFGCFTYIYGKEGNCTGITTRAQTGNGNPTQTAKEKLTKLWPSYLMSDSTSTNVVSNVNSGEYDKVQTRLMKKNKGKSPVSKNIAPETEDCHDDGCPRCGKRFMRIGCLRSHSTTCEGTEMSSRKTSQQMRDALPVKEAMGAAQKARQLQADFSSCFVPGMDGEVDIYYAKMLQGSALKHGVKKSVRFTQAQKEIMEKCFDEGEGDKRKRYTASKCKRLMENSLEEEMVLNEGQIKSYWSAYRRKKQKLG